MTARRVALAGGIAILLAVSPPAQAARGYDYYVTGNPADVVTPTTGLLVLQGGGTDVDENFVRMGARSGGGDQSRYVQFWKSTPIEDAIHHVAGKPAPVGGTSAGMAVMSEFLYAAMTNSSLTSEEALADPFHRDMTLDRDFLALAKLGGMITDQHLQERDRMGRTVAFLARIVHDSWATQARAIAADRETAVHVNPADGTAEVFATPTHATPYVYFLETSGPPEVCAPDTPLTYRNVAVYRIGPGGTFDLDRWKGTHGISYTLSAVAGVLTSSNGSVY